MIKVGFLPSDIRYALREEAPEILELLKSCFPQNYLLFSIYQAKETIGHIEALISQQELGDKTEVFKILHTDNVLLGFYNARVISDNLFLSYIGTRPGFENKKIGALLLQDFHQQAHKNGLQKCQLDVYASNYRAFDWYSKNGYLESNRSYNLAFERINPASGTKNPVFDKALNLLAEKETEETSKGFSKIRIDLDQNAFEMMMIAGKTLRIQNLVNILEDQVLDLIAGSPLKARKYFLFTGRPEYKGNNPLLFAEKVIRMTKPLFPVTDADH